MGLRPLPIIFLYLYTYIILLMSGVGNYIISDIQRYIIYMTFGDDITKIIIN